MRRAVVVLFGLVALSLPVTATASDAQVKSVVTKAIAAAKAQQGTTLKAAVVKLQASARAAAPTSANGKKAKALAVQALAKEAAGAAAQIKADQANTKMQYGTATSQTAVATKDLQAAVALLHKAAALL
jgi:hypothetical protein